MPNIPRLKIDIELGIQNIAKLIITSGDASLYYCGICLQRQLPILIQEELERSRVRSTRTQALGTSGEV